MKKKNRVDLVFGRATERQRFLDDLGRESGSVAFRLGDQSERYGFAPRLQPTAGRRQERHYSEWDGAE